MSQQYWTQLTESGRQKVLAAIANQGQINISHFAVGDGFITAQSQDLLSEKYRSTINTLQPSAEGGALIEAIAVVPAHIGGFHVREAAFYTDDGSAFAIVKYPDTFKPEDGDNATAELVLKAIIDVVQEGVVTEKIDPSLTYARKDWVQTKFDRAVLKGEVIKAPSATFDNGTNTTVNIYADNSGLAALNVCAEESNGQTTGRVYVGQSLTYGGGIEYNGDNAPATTGAGADYFTLFRKENGALHWTARNNIHNNNWEFRGAIQSPNFIENGQTLENKYQAKSDKLARFESSLIDTNGGQDLSIRNKRAFVGTEGRLYINYGSDWSHVDANGTWRFTGDVEVKGDLKMSGSDSYIWTPNTENGATGIWDQVNKIAAMKYTNGGQFEFGSDIKIEKNNPWLTLKSSGSGSENKEQAAGISIGEGGRDTSTSLHLSYIGNGRSYIGMGNLGEDNIPDNWAMQMAYSDTWVKFRSSILLGDENTSLSKGSFNALKIKTHKGYVEIGPQNGTHCHYATDRPNHYFNKDVRVKGELYAGSGHNQRVYHQGFKPTASEVGAFQRHSGQTPIVNKDGFTTIAKVIGSNLASSINLQLKGTVGYTVVNVNAAILVNHHKDIVIDSMCGGFTPIQLKVLSNNNEQYLIQAKLLGGNPLSLHCHILSYTNDNVSIGSYDTGGFIFEHTHTVKLFGRQLSSSGETGMRINGHDIYHQGFKPTPADIGAMAKSDKLTRFEGSLIDINGSHDFTIRGKRALVGFNDKLIINYNKDWANVEAAGDWTYKGDITLYKNNPWLTLDSANTGNNNNEQAAGISLGESGRLAAASLHLSYTGNGFSHIGMGNLGEDNIPDNWTMQMSYTSTWVKFRSAVLLGDGNTNLSKGGSNSLRIKTNHGLVDIGPQNSGHCHYATDRSSHWFDKKVLVNGEIYAGSGYSKRVYHEGYKPSASDVGAMPLSGGRFTGDIFAAKKRSFNTTLASSPNANGLYVWSHTNQQRVGGAGIYSPSGTKTGARAYLGLGESPWNGGEGIIVNGSEFKYCGKDVIHQGNIAEFAERRQVLASGTLKVNSKNHLTASTTFTLPQVDTLSEGDAVVISKAMAATPTIKTFGSEHIAMMRGTTMLTDTSVLFDKHVTLTFILNNQKNWEMQ